MQAAPILEPQLGRADVFVRLCVTLRRALDRASQFCNYFLRIMPVTHSDSVDTDTLAGTV